MTESIYDIVHRANADAREKGDAVNKITLRSLRPLEGMLTVPAESEETRLFGIPVHLNEHVPKGHGILQSPCNHS